MVAKLVAGACVVALAAISSQGASRSARGPSTPVVLRASMPLPFASDHGYASFSSSLGRTQLRFAAIWSPGKEHGRLAVMVASEPDDSTE